MCISNQHRLYSYVIKNVYKRQSTIEAERINIAIVDDHEVFTSALKYVLNDEEEIDVVFTANNGKIFLEKIEKNTVDVILLDLDMPVMDGRQALHILRKKYLELHKVIILSLHYSTEHVRKYMRAGANAYLAKDCTQDTLVEAIKSVHEKGYFFHGEVSPELLSELVDSKPNSSLALTGDPLSKREVQVIQFLCKGMTSPEIAKKLQLSIRTVENHRHRIAKKIKAKNTADIVVYAIKHGYYDLRY